MYDFVKNIDLLCFHFTIEISFIAALMLHQVLQVTLWLELSKVTFVASFSVSRDKLHST